MYSMLGWQRSHLYLRSDSCVSFKLKHTHTMTSGSGKSSDDGSRSDGESHLNDSGGSGGDSGSNDSGGSGGDKTERRVKLLLCILKTKNVFIVIVKAGVLPFVSSILFPNEVPIKCICISIGLVIALCELSDPK